MTSHTVYIYIYIIYAKIHFVHTCMKVQTMVIYFYFFIIYFLNTWKFLLLVTPLAYTILYYVFYNILRITLKS